MKLKTLQEAVKEAKRFIRVADKIKTHNRFKYPSLEEYTKESSAVRRASMDLTRILADLRQNR